jgi:hypothetical protein
MPSYVARPHVLADEFVPGYLGDSFGLFPPLQEISDTSLPSHITPAPERTAWDA